MSVHELQPEAVEARLRAGKKTPNLGKTPVPPPPYFFSVSVLFSDKGFRKKIKSNVSF